MIIMDNLKKILSFLSLFLVLLIVKEFIEFYAMMNSLHPVMGYISVVLTVIILYYFVGIPIQKILVLPKAIEPQKRKRKKKM